ncbi:MAG TPA: iron ABC transporter permease [Proteobacteria bacterium]|nr:iron ABC transporter permease [Pseudomonadota bacterium]
MNIQRSTLNFQRSTTPGKEHRQPANGNRLPSSVFRQLSKSKQRTIVIFMILIAALVLVSIGSLQVGTVSFSFARILRMFFDSLFGKTDSSIDATIVFRLRLPRIILGIVVGGGLAVSGVLFQGLFRNPLVEPYTLGVSGGAALGVSLGFLLGGAFPQALLPLFGFAGAWLAVSFAYTIARRRRFLKIPYLLLVGVMISFICSALIMLLLSVVNLSTFRAVIYWTMGSLAGCDITLIRFAVPVILLGTAASLGLAWTLNALALGEEGAHHLGIRLERDKKWIFFLGALLAGTAVSVAGIIGFVGLIVPHTVRLLFGNDHRSLIPASFLAGGIFLVLCDTLARTVLAPMELPVGVVTGILGGGIFIYLLSRKSSG